MNIDNSIETKIKLHKPDNHPFEIKFAKAAKRQETIPLMYFEENKAAIYVILSCLK